ncbi:MAG: cellulase family glycosylhydrolase [Microscillaceae bacterium]|jgi:hypothetical protein|nr:cellulase family glycosylhydrolase [Microscillaceae bacterium]
MHIDGPYFKDDSGRVLMLRGVNLGGSAKIPAVPNLATHIKFGIYETKISFVGRPFPLKKADEHFKRLQSWGFTFVRFLITWEAIEHKGPGVYDEDYLEYVYQVVKKAQEYGIQVMIDPHQDVWSRFSGGDGAPRWTFEKIGLDVKNFAETGAAILHHTYSDDLPEMIWATNYSKLASATMFTLFFGGNDFAPEILVDEQPIQEYLQSHYLQAIRQVAIKLQDLDNVVGFDTLNEPSTGWIGWQDLAKNEALFRKGAMPSPFESMAAASGKPMQVENWEFSRRGMKAKGLVEINPKGIKAWISGFKCIWRQHAVWDLDEKGNSVLLKPDYFAQVKGKKVDFQQDYLKPFINQFAATIQEVMPQAIIFAEFPINEKPTVFSENDASNLVNASHWYDVLTLLTKNYRSWLTIDTDTRKLVWGRKKVRQLFATQLAKIKQASEVMMNNCPTLIGEMGIPMDMRHKKAYRNGNFIRQIKALDACFFAIEENLLHVTLWNYNPENTNQHGDLWNKEDLSIFSYDQQTDPQDLNSGGRALQAAIRPYPMKIAGKPIRLSFDIRKKVFEFEFEHENTAIAPTEIFVPNFQYPEGYKVFVTDGEFEIDIEKQLVSYKHSSDKTKHGIRIVKN